MNQGTTQKARSSVRWTALNTITITAIQFAQLAILGRLLSPSAFGLMAMILVVLEIAKVFSEMGLSEAIIAKKNATKNQLSSLYWTNVFAGIMLYCALFISTPAIAAFFGEKELQQMLPVMATIFIVSAFGIQFEALLRKYLYFNIFTIINIHASVFSFLVVVGLAWKGYGVWSLVFGHIALYVAKFLALFCVAWKKKWLPGLHFNFGEIHDHFFFGLCRMGAMGANYLNSRVDQLVIGSLLGPISLGYYSVAFRISLQPIQRINPILTQVAFPVFSMLQDDNARLRRGYLKMVRLLMSINAPLLVGLSAVAPLAVPFLMGSQWVPSVPIVQVLSFYALFRAVGNSGGSILLAKNKANWALYWNLAMALLIPPTVYIAFMIQGSILAICFALIILQIGILFLVYHLMLKRLLGDFLLEYVKAIGKPLLSSLIMGIVVYSIQGSLSNLNSIIGLTVSLILGIVVYAIASIFIQRSLFTEYFDMVPLSIGNRLVWIGKVFSR